MNHVKREYGAAELAQHQVTPLGHLVSEALLLPPQLSLEWRLRRWRAHHNRLKYQEEAGRVNLRETAGFCI